MDKKILYLLMTCAIIAVLGYEIYVVADNPLTKSPVSAQSSASVHENQ